MKFVVVILVVALFAWLFLRGRKRDLPSAPPAAPQALPQAMVACLHCGVHLPRSDALTDERGAYCTKAHQLAGPREP